MKDSSKTGRLIKSNAAYWSAAAIVIIITFIIYLPSLQNGFVNWDDDAYVYEDIRIRSLNAGFLIQSLVSDTMGLWHPLPTISFAFDYAMWGLNPSGYHLTNIILHSVNAALVYLLAVGLIRRWTGVSRASIASGIVSALLFAIHPLRIESVVWVSERKDVLSAFFFLLSIIAYLKYSSIRDLKRLVFYGLAVLFLMLSLMSKPMAVTFPLVLLIIDYCPLRRFAGGSGTLKTLIFEKLPFLLLSIISILITMWPTITGHGSQNPDTPTLDLRIFVAIQSYIFYLVKMILPFNLAPFYSYPSRIDYLVLSTSLILLAGITSLCLIYLKRNPAFLAAWSYYIITLIPVTGIVKICDYAAGDHYTYLPGLGPSLLAGAAAVSIFERFSKQYRATIIIILFLVASIMGAKTLRQIGIWKDSVTLWSREIAIFPYEKIGYLYRGEAYNELGIYEKALDDYDMAIKLGLKHGNVYFQRGSIYYRLGDYQRAISSFNTAIDLNPEDGEAYNYRGYIHYLLGNYQQAVTDLNMAIQCHPAYTEAYYNLGSVYSRIGNNEIALFYYKKAADLGSEKAKEFLKDVPISH